MQDRNHRTEEVHLNTTGPLNREHAAIVPIANRVDDVQFTSTIAQGFEKRRQSKLDHVQQDIHVLGRAHIAAEGHAEPANQRILGSLRVEQLDNL